MFRLCLGVDDHVVDLVFVIAWFVVLVNIYIILKNMNKQLSVN